jgi:protein phosphatase 2C family protein 2/3
VQHSKISSKAQGYVAAYAANTHNGTSRNYNEDRISIVLDLKKPGSKPDEPLGPGIKQASFFAVFDGHGGHGCAEFLRDNLHNIIANQPSFPSNPEKALFAGFQEAEDTFMRQNL